MRTFRNNKKGQSAMEYLMTYGWAILIVIIVAAVLFSLGVFDPSSYTQTAAVGFSGFNVPAGGFQLSSTSGNITMQLTNGVGANIDITSTCATVGTTEACNTSIGAVGPGQTTTIIYGLLSGLTSGSAYSADVTITWTNVDTGLTGFVSTGTLSGIVS